MPLGHAEAPQRHAHSVFTLCTGGTRSVQGWPDLCFRALAQGRKLFPRQDALFKGLVNVLWLFNFTTIRSGLQEIIDKDLKSTIGAIQIDSWLRIATQIFKEDFRFFVFVCLFVCLFAY